MGTLNPARPARQQAAQAPGPWLDSAQAAAWLGVSAATLYAYVSRGRLRSERDPQDPRRSRFRRQELELLRARRDWRRAPEGAARQGLRGGVPVLDSALTLIADGRLYYRGRAALELARRAGLERVAALLWTGDERQALRLFGAQAAGSRAAQDIRSGRPAHALVPGGRAGGLTPVERAQVALPAAGARDPAAHDLRPASVAACGVRILAALADALGAAPGPGSLAQRLQRGWAPGRPRAARALDTALVLCADHELNVSAFTARCVASAGANPYDVVAAGLAALKGVRHGGYTQRVEALCAEVGRPARAQAVVAARLRRGEEVPGFGHPLYAQGDPRGAALVELAARLAPRAEVVRLGTALCAAARELLDSGPTLDLGLVMLAGALRLPEGAPLALFALGRAVGWVAHAIEEYAEGSLVRPRARYVGPPPGETEADRSPHNT